MIIGLSGCARIVGKHLLLDPQTSLKVIDGLLVVVRFETDFAESLEAISGLEVQLGIAFGVPVGRGNRCQTEIESKRATPVGKAELVRTV